MKNIKTTVLGILEAFFVALTPDMIMDQPDWRYRIIAIGLAAMRATFGVLAADAQNKQGVSDA